MAHRQTEGTGPVVPSRFEPYVPATESPAEFTLKAIVLGVLFGLLFGASTVYLGLRAGLTVSASIPIAVLAISVSVSSVIFSSSRVSCKSETAS